MAEDGYRDAQGFAELRSYAAIGDGRTVALVAQDGRIDWLPVPNMDSPPAFAALLDAEQGGYLDLRPVGPFTVSRAYLPDTNVLTTTFHTAGGSVRITDSLNAGVAGRLPWAELARRIDGLDGQVSMMGTVQLGTCFNAASPWVRDTAFGPVLQIDGVNLAVRSLGENSCTIGTDRVQLEFSTSSGSRQLLGVVATYQEPLLLVDPEVLDAGVDRTIASWQSWSKSVAYDGPFADQVRRSALALKLLIFAPTGAIAAAATTSLPEWPGTDTNWEYRLAWVRDAAYALTALFRFGLREEIHGAMSWLLTTIRSDGEPQVAYELNGGRLPEEKLVDIPGWRGHGPVRTGNRARSQLQLGVFGDLFSIVGLYVKNGNVLDAATGRTLATTADLAADTWRTRDSGMWELTDERHYVTSKMGCWKALTEAADLVELGEIPGDAKRWRTEAERIREWVQEHGWSAERNTYVWYPGTRDLDASVLLHAISGFDRGPRMSATLDALRAELGAGPHLYRMSQSRGHEGTFVACSFWMVSALALVGRRDEALELMDELVGQTNDVGLLAEMIHPGTGEFLGNLPQALSHLALMHAALTLAETEKD